MKKYEIDIPITVLYAKELQKMADEKATGKQVGGEHYKNLKIHPVDYIYQNNLDFLEGNIIKYVTRHRQKGQSKDIRKVIHYAELILQLVYDETP